MDILVVSRCPPWPLNRGDRLIVYHLARTLSGRGHRLDLLAFDDDEGAREHEATKSQSYELAANVFAAMQFIAEPTRAPWQYLARQLRPEQRFPARARDSWSPPMWEAITARLDAVHYDAMLLFGGVAVYEYRSLARALPNVIAPYESFALYLERAARHARGPLPWLSSRLRLWIARAYERWMFAGFDRVVVVSEADAATLRARAPSLPVEVIPNGVDVDCFAPDEGARAERDPATLIFTGHFGYAPNVDAALVLAREVLPLVRRQVAGARLALVGADPPPALRALAGAEVVVTGYVADMRPHLGRATVYVSPLRLGAGIKNKILEAMAMALPVVATPLSCDGIDVTDGEHVLLAESPAALAEKAVRLLADGDLRARLARNARALVEARYTWGGVGARYEALFEQVIAQRRRPAPAAARPPRS